MFICNHQTLKQKSQQSQCQPILPSQSWNTPGNAVATPANHCGFVVNGNLNYWSLFGLIPLLAAIRDFQLKKYSIGV
ncbi:hypothetical protein [Nostoc sp.]|uniref:hypothetical protein n=1 Tax=Nostoc sp. TaxID=1180 RepID=UPI002FF5DB8F